MVIVVDSPSVMLMYYDSSLICFFVSVADDVYHPFQVANQRLTEEGSDRDVRHFELEDPSSVCHLYYNP